MNKLLTLFILLVSFQVILCVDGCYQGWKFEDTAYYKICTSKHELTYGRGVGYPWKFGDKLNLNAAKKRCEDANPGKGCEQWGAIMYPKCVAGYSPSGCCTCLGKCPGGYYHYIDIEPKMKCLYDVIKQ